MFDPVGNSGMTIVNSLFFPNHHPLPELPLLPKTPSSSQTSSVFPNHHLLVGNRFPWSPRSLPSNGPAQLRTTARPNSIVHASTNSWATRAILSRRLPALLTFPRSYLYFRTEIAQKFDRDPDNYYSASALQFAPRGSDLSVFAGVKCTSETWENDSDFGRCDSTRTRSRGSVREAISLNNSHMIKAVHVCTVHRPFIFTLSLNGIPLLI
ncbi:hypothetical protein MVEN_00021300 [Mycena venus]|uniref:Uncharacterized protein n=1 Tax=Mycena venus TaxID=2733690 RepID=A0A8H6Z2Z0_9AGAR|nr:hypothetical protein MVEN_00021300 [Mycena venus]